MKILLINKDNSYIRHSFNLEKLEKEQMLKVPWIVFILKAAKIWRASHNGLLPKNFKEKEEFKKLILDK